MSRFVGDDLEALSVHIPNGWARCSGMLCADVSEGRHWMLKPVKSDNLWEKTLDERVVAKNRSN